MISLDEAKASYHHTCLSIYTIKNNQNALPFRRGSCSALLLECLLLYFLPFTVISYMLNPYKPKIWNPRLGSGDMEIGWGWT